MNLSMVRDEIISACRICGSDNLKLILSLGNMPLANAFLRPEQLGDPEDRYPLDVVFCQKCSLVQITQTVSPEKLFREYLYFSSFSDTVLRNAKEISERVISQFGLGSESLVIEIASNDGYLLQFYHQRGIPVLGIEPAYNIAKVAQEKGIRTISEFFGRSLAHKLLEQGIKADVVHANNVLAHVADLHSFVEGIYLILKQSGVCIIEVPYIKDLIDHREFDTIYHEHLCYYSLTSLDKLFRMHGLVVYDVERIPIHGGSIRIFVAKEGSREVSHSVKNTLIDERDWGVNNFEFYVRFADQVQALRYKIRETLFSLKQDGNKIAAYGAAAKGTILLNYCGIGRETIDFVADRNPKKQGLYMPGVRIPIYPTSKILEDMPDYLFILAWNFADEIIDQQRDYQRRGGKFIIPVPEVRIL